MKYIAPDYYGEFTCIAGACRHSCCIGWEIDIDQQSFDRFSKMEGDIGARIRSAISLEGDGPHYILTENDRCPFLRKDGLCDMILELGENALCQICTDHPRFRNCFSDREEIGLGLCCEAAGTLILKRTEPMTLIVMDTDENGQEKCSKDEETLLSFRKMLFSILQDRSCTIDERMEELLETCGGMPQRTISQWASALLTLERLDDEWTVCLQRLESCGELRIQDFETQEWACAFEQTAVYFLYRHLPAALDDGDVASKAAFCVLSVQILRALCAEKRKRTGEISLDDLVEFARMYSGEIEYSEENLDQIFSWLACVHM